MNELARDEKREAAVRRVDALAHLLDNSIPVPGTGMRFGLDAVIGLGPGVGDAAGALLSSWIVLEGARLGAGVTVVLRMLLNVAIEGGTVGDLTLRVSDLPSLEEGERAVFFLDAAAGNDHVPHRRGNGVMKLSDNDRVVGSQLSLSDVRQQVAEATGRGLGAR